MKLADWKDVGTVYFQDQFPLLLKSTIKCEYGGIDIKITDCGQRNEIEKIDTTGAPVPGFMPDFNIKFELDKTENTVVPFGILDFENKIENQFFRFKYTLEKFNIDAFYFEIISEDGDLLYENNCLKAVITHNDNKEKLFKPEKDSHIPMTSAEAPLDSPDLEPKDYTAMGNYIISWDGFDTNEIYDSTRFNGKDLKAKITAIKDGMQKSIVVDFSTKYNQVQWTDVKIDRKAKCIDVILRLNLTDGGAKGLECHTYTTEKEESYETFTPTNSQDPFAGIKTTICDWNKIPKKVISASGKKDPIQTRTKTFKELQDLAIAGLGHYWGRNSSRGKNVILDDVAYEVFVNAVNSSKNALNSLPLVYNTNGDWMRSGNTGSGYFDESLADNIIDSFPDAGVIQRLSYNVGYIEYSNGWAYSFENDEDEKFQETAAHELGHELLQAYGGAAFSYQHKGSSYYFPQDTKPLKGKETVWEYATHRDKIPETSGENYPVSGEVDLMKYYNNDRIKDKSRTIADEKDVLGLIWLTKIKVK